MKKTIYSVLEYIIIAYTELVSALCVYHLLCLFCDQILSRLFFCTTGCVHLEAQWNITNPNPDCSVCELVCFVMSQTTAKNKQTNKKVRHGEVVKWSGHPVLPSLLLPLSPGQARSGARVSPTDGPLTKGHLGPAKPVVLHTRLNLNSKVRIDALSPWWFN